MARRITLVACLAALAAAKQNPLPDTWDDVQSLLEQASTDDNPFLAHLLQQTAAKSSNELTHASTIAHALRLSLGDLTYTNRITPYVVHLAGFSSFREGLGIPHEAYFTILAHYLRVLLPRVGRLHLVLVGPDTRRHPKLDFDWLQVTTRPVYYHDFMDGKDWSAPDLWLAEHAGLWDAFWPRGGGCVVNAGPNGKGEEISKERILAAEATDGAVPYACLWRGTFERMNMAEDVFPIFVTAAHRGEDTLARRLLRSVGLKLSPEKQEDAVNPFAEAWGDSPYNPGELVPVGMVDLSNAPFEPPNSLGQILWAQYVEHDHEFDAHEYYAKNRYLLRVEKSVQWEEL
mmetsp:Transcript_23348/g.72127  ORF Transcript_23348/g.72127 Transcript_23348/m.72127 type:complete len:345 (+) Transcript_23348:310-1344(+)